MRALIVGSGSIGRRHASNIRQIEPGCQMAFLRRSLGKPEGVVNEVEVYNELDKALEQTVDFAVIASPSSAHLKTLVPLLMEKIPCYVEKPVVGSREELESLKTYIQDIELPVTMVGCNLRFLPSLERLHKLIMANELGPIIRALLEVGSWLPDWRPKVDYRTVYSARKSQGGGVVLDLIHEIDIARWLFGDFNGVKSFAGQFSSLEIDSEDVAVALLQAKGRKPLVTLNLDYIARKNIRRYTIVGEQGTVVWDLATQSMVLSDKNGDSVLAANDDFDINRSYIAAMRHFIDCAKTGEYTRQPIMEGIKSLELALRIKDESGV